MRPRKISIDHFYHRNQDHQDHVDFSNSEASLISEIPNKSKARKIIMYIYHEKKPLFAKKSCDFNDLYFMSGQVTVVF